MKPRPRGSGPAKLGKAEQQRAEVTVSQGGFSVGQRVKVLGGSSGKWTSWLDKGSVWRVRLDNEERSCNVPSKKLRLEGDVEECVSTPSELTSDGTNSWLGRQAVTAPETGDRVEVWHDNAWVDAVVAPDETQANKHPTHEKQPRKMIRVVCAGDCLSLLVPIGCLRRKENYQVHHRRLEACALARKKLCKNTISTNDVLAVLRCWGFTPNALRTNVILDGESWVYSDTLGLVSGRSKGCVESSLAKLYPDVMHLLSRWLWDSGTEYKHFPFTSINVNFAYAARLHRDGNNAGPSVLRSLGHLEGGELGYFPDDDRFLPIEKLPRASKTLINTKRKFHLIDGKRAHSVERFTGERFSVVFFSCGSYKKASTAQKLALKSSGVTWPTPSSLASFERRLGSPRGCAKASTAETRKRPASPSSSSAEQGRKWHCVQEPPALKKHCNIVKESAVANAPVQNRDANRGMSYKLLTFPHLGLKLSIGSMYTCASLVKRCRGDPKRLAALRRKLADPATFRPLDASSK